jgi:hypothetical protein
LDAAEPKPDAALAAVPEEFTQQEYVYLSRVEVNEPPPKAKMPTVELPAAEPP